MDPIETLTRLRARLIEKAYLFDEPHSYICAVEDTLEAVARELPGMADDPQVEIDLTRLDVSLPGE